MESKSSAVILARVSSKAQRNEGYSLDAQLKLLQSHSDSKGLSVSKVFMIAETASKEQGRKTFNEMLTYVRHNNVYHIVVEKSDRFARNFRDAVTIDDWLNEDDSRRLHDVKENLLLHKNAKSDVKFMWNIHISVAKKFTDNLREEAMKGWAEKLAQGWLPAPPPPGYMTVIENGKRVHAPDPATKSIMQRMFKQYLEPSHSIMTITQEMNLLGIRTRKGRPYAKSHVQRILSNPFYVGINHFDGKDYPGAQEPLISIQLYQTVQLKMHKGRPSVYYKHNPVLKNMITCAICGKAITWQKQKGRYYGACQRSSPSCRGKKLLREDKVENAIIEQLKRLVCPSEEVIEWLANSIREDQRDNLELRKRILASIEIQLARLKRMDSDMYDDKLAGDIAKEKYDVKHEEFMSQISNLENKRGKVDASLSQGLEQRLMILKLAQKAASIYRTKSPEQKRLIITKLFANITAEDGSVSVTFTNFSRAIAQRSLKTSNLLGGKI